MDALQTLMVWSPFVVCMRLPLLAGETLMFDASDRTETNRLVSEKVGAMVEGVAGMQTAGLSAALRFFGNAVSFNYDPSAVASAVMSITAAGFEPAAVRVRDNVERLAAA